jgi:hypothetical protein
MTMERVSLLSALGLCGIVAVAAARPFTNSIVPSFRGQPNTEFGGWESFMCPSACPNFPDDPNSTTGATLIQLDPSAFLVGGNIYSFSAPLRCVIEGSVPADLQRVVLQLSTRAVVPNYASVKLEYVDPFGNLQQLPWTTFTKLKEITGPMGTDVEALFEWDLTGVIDPILDYKLLFNASQASMSLDAVLLDLQHSAPVPAYCTAKSNLACGLPAIAAQGSSSAAAPSGFWLTAAPARGDRTGVLLYNTQRQVPATPFLGGLLCVAPSGLRRAGPANSGGTAGGCNGTFAIDMNAFAQGLWPQPSTNPAPYLLTPGQAVACQWWGRDSVATGSLLSDALEYVVQP